MLSVDLTRVVVQEGFLPAGCCPLHAQRGSHSGCSPGSSYLQGTVPYMLIVDLTRVVVQEGFLPGGCCPYMLSVDLTRVVVQEALLPAGYCPLHAQRGSHSGCSPGSSYLQGTVPYMLSVDLTRVVIQEALTCRVLSPTCSAWISLGL